MVLVTRPDVLPVVAGICLVIFNYYQLILTLRFTMAVWYFKKTGRKILGDANPRKFAERHRTALTRSKALIQSKHWKRHLCMWRETASRWF